MRTTLEPGRRRRCCRCCRRRRDRQVHTRHTAWYRTSPLLSHVYILFFVRTTRIGRRTETRWPIYRHEDYGEKLIFRPFGLAAQ